MEQHITIFHGSEKIVEQPVFGAGKRNNDFGLGFYCTASEALARSTEMMRGYKARLFCLDLSFFGWRLLGILTLGIGNLWVNPYSTLSTAAFYRWRCQENPAFAPPAQETP